MGWGAGGLGKTEARSLEQVGTGVVAWRGAGAELWPSKVRNSKTAFCMGFWVLPQYQQGYSVWGWGVIMGVIQVFTTTKMLGLVVVLLGMNFVSGL